MSVAHRYAGVLAVLVASGCGFELPPPSYITGTELIMVRHSVEIGPLDPERVGPSFVGMEKAPIAEVLPGDRLRLEVVVVDRDGRQLPRDQLETLWVQCRASCLNLYIANLDFSWSLFDRRCEENVDNTLGNHCMLGSGDGAFEFEVPPLGLDSLFGVVINELPRVGLFGVVAWDGRAAEDCWTARRADQSLDRCGFIYHHVAIGPVGWAIANAEALGTESPLDEDEELPAFVQYQPANRIPLAPSLTVRIDDEIVAIGVPPLSTIGVAPGDRISIEASFDPLSQALQRIIKPLSEDGGWKLVDERLFLHTATSGAIRRVGADEPIRADGQLSYEVDPQAQPGRSRVLILYSDERYGADLLSLEFEVQ